MSFRIATKVSDVTKDYIRRSLAYQYSNIRPEEFSEKLIDTLHSDFLAKVREFRWLFGDNVRVSVPISDKEKAKVLRENTDLSTFLNEMAGYGYKTTNKSLVNAKFIKDKQEIKFSKAISQVKKDAGDFKKLVGKTVTVSIKRPPNVSMRGDEFSSFTGAFTDRATGLPNPFVTEVRVLSVAAGNIFVEFNGSVANKLPKVMPIPEKMISVVLPFHTDHTVYTEIVETAGASSITLSIDINDYITCSSGTFSSCLGKGGAYHNGWQQMFRTPFALISFVEKGLFYKTGRMWVFSHVTRNGQPDEHPLVRFQKTYGTVKGPQVAAMLSMIKERYKEAFGKKLKLSNKNTDQLNTRYISANLAGQWGSKAGYLDTSGGVTYYEDENFYVQRESRRELIKFADALDLKGRITADARFKSPKGDGPLGFTRVPRYVTCSVTNKQVLEFDAIQLQNGNWVSRTAIESILEVPVEIREPESVTAEDTESIPVEDVVITEEGVFEF